MRVKHAIDQHAYGNHNYKKQAYNPLRHRTKAILLCATFATVAAAAMLLWSQVQTAGAQASIPAITPTVAAVSGSDTSLNVSWTLAPGTSLDSIEYAYRRGTHTSLPSSITWTEVTDTDDPTDGSADETSQVISGLYTGNNYTVWVRGVKAGSTAPTPTGVTAATTGLWTPTDLTTRFPNSIGRNSIATFWHRAPHRSPAAAVNRFAVVDVKCEPSSSPTSGGWTRLGKISSGRSHTGLTANTEYLCSVRTSDGVQYSFRASDNFSSVATIKATTLTAVNAPTSLAVASEIGYPGQATLTWVKNSGVTTQTGFQYRYAEGTAAPADGVWVQDWIDVPGSTAATLTYDVTGLKHNTQYYFQVRSKNSGRNGPSAAVGQSGTTTSAPTPSAPTASSITTSSFTLQWIRPTALAAAFTAYEWQYRYKKTATGGDFTTATGGATWTSVADSTLDADSDAHNETQVSITGLTAATAYQFQVRMLYTGDVGASDASSVTVNTWIPSITPSVRTGGEGSLTATWTIPAGVSVDRLEYAYRIGTHTALPTDITWTRVTDSDTPPDGNADERLQAINGLNTGNTYTVWVRGVKAGHTSAAPVGASAQTGGLPTPTGLIVRPTSNGIILRFDARPSGRGITYVQYQCVVTGRPASTTWQDRSAVSSAVTVGSLASNTSYTCRIRFRTGGRFASLTDLLSSTLTVQAKTYGYVAPILSATAGSAAGSTDLSWTMPANHNPSNLTFDYRYEKGTAAPDDDDWDSGTGWQDIQDGNYDASTREGSLTLTGLEGGEAYHFQLRVRYSGTNPRASSSTVAAKGVDGPTSLTVAARTGYPGQANLTWDKNTARNTHTGFQYRYEEGSAAVAEGMWDQDWAAVPGSDGTTTTYAVPGLKAGTQYYFQVRAVHSGNVGKSEPIGQVGTTAAAPTVAAPTTSNVAGVSLTLSWTTPAALNSAFTAYEWQYRYRAKPPNPATAWTASWASVPDSPDDADSDAHNESSVTVTGLTGLTEYEFQVRINFTGNVGETAASAAATATTLIPSITPTVAMTSGDDRSLTATWSNPAGVTLDGFEYAYQQGTHTSLPASITWQDVPDSGSDGRGNETSQAISGLNSGTTYTVWIRGEKSGSTSADPMPATASTSGPWYPTGLAATPGGTSIALDWDDRPSASAAANFEYRCEPTSSPTSGGWNAIAASTSAATASSLSINTAYTCSLRSRNGSAGSYSYSSPIATTTATTLAILAPTLSAAAGTDLRTVDLTWTLPSGFDATLSGFQYRYEQGATDPGAGNWDLDWTDVPDDTDASDPDTDRHDERAYSITGLTGNTGYYIQLRAQYGAETSAEDDATATAKAVAAPSVNPASIDLSPTPQVHPGAIELSWYDVNVVIGQFTIPGLQPPGNVRDVYGPPTYRTGYEYRYEKGSAAPSNGMWDQDWTDVPDADDPPDGRGDENAITLTGLEFNTAYYIQIRSQNSGGYGDSDAVSVSRTSGDAPASIPTPTAPNVTDTTVTLQWTDLGGVVREFTEYNWQYRYRIKPGSGTPAWTATWNDVADGDDTGTSAHDENRVQVTGLTAATDYEFQIRIKSGAGASSPSSTVSAKTEIGSITPTVGAGANDNSLAVSWTIAPGVSVDGFEYAYRQGTHGNDPGSRATWHDVADSGSDGRSNETSVTISGLNSGTTYTVWLRGEKSGFAAASSVAVTQTTSGPWWPTGFALTRAARSLTLSWDSKPASASVDHFQYKCATSNLAGASWSTTADGTATSAVVSSLNVGTSYMCIIRSRTGAAGSYAYSSPALTALAATTLAFLPPEASTAAAGTAKGAVALSWRVPTAASPSLSGFEYRYKKSSDAAYPTTGAGSWASAGGQTTTSLAITGLDGNTGYDFQLRSVFGTTGYSDSTSTLTTNSGAVPGPTSLTVAARAGYPGQAVLTWVKNTGVTTQTGFQYRYEEGSSAPAQPTGWDTNWTDVPSGTGATTTYTITGLKAGTTYYFQVRSTNPGTDGPSAPVSQSGATTAAPTVATPSTSNVTATSLTLAWTRPAPLNSAFTAYQWQYRYKTTASGSDFTTATGGVPWTSVADSTRDADSDAHNETQIDITGLAGTTEYQFQVRINFTGAVGESAASASATVKTLIPSISPTVTATSGNDNGLTANWTSPSGGTLDSLEYAYVAGTHTNPPAGTSWTAVTDTDLPADGNIDETSQAITGLNSGTTYTVWVRGVKAVFTTTAPPAQSASTSGPWRPTGLTATPAGTSIALDWDDRPSASVASHFEYKCEPTASPTSAGWSAIVASTSAATVSSLSVDTAYTCTVRSRTGAAGSYEYSSPAVTATAMTAAHLVPTLTASAGSTVGSIDLSWTIVSGYESTLSGFQYRWEVGAAAPGDGNWDSGAGWQAIALSAFDSSTRNGSLTLSSGLVGNTGYFIELRAVYGTEYSSASSDTATSGAVAAPTSLTLAARTGYPGHVTMSWQDATNTDRNGYQYRYEEGSAAPGTGNMWDQDWTAVPSSTGATRSFNLNGLKAGTQYYVQLRATHGNDKGNSAPASATGTTTAAPSVAAPSTASVNATSLTLSWTSPAALNAAFTAYQWQYRYRTKPTNPADAWTATWNTVADSGTDGAHNESSVAVTGLSGTTEYEFQVRIDFTGSVGESAASTAATVKTLIPSITPSVATGANVNSLAVSWTAPAGGTPDGFEYAYQQGTHTSLPAGVSWNDVPDSGSDGRSNETSYAIPSLDSGTIYTVWLRGEKSGFTSAAPVAVTQTTSGPWRPTGLSATGAGTSIALDWDDRPSAGAATHFEYKCEPTASPTNSGWMAIAASTSAATASSLAVNTAHTCSVRSRTGAAGSYAYSSPVTTTTATTLAHVAPNLLPRPDSAVGSIIMAWTMPLGYDSSLSAFQYRYEQGTSAATPGNWDSASGQGWRQLGMSRFNSGTRMGSFTITGRAGNAVHYIEMRAVYGTEYSSAVSDTVSSGAVAAPTSYTLAARTGYPGQLTVSWQDATNADRNGYQYRYEEGAAAPGTGNMWDQDWTAVPSSTGATQTFNLTGLKAGTQYYVQVRSTNGNNMGNSAAASASGTTTAAPTVAAPSTSSVTATSLTLSWTTPNTLNSAFTAYQWQYRQRTKPTNPADAWTATWNTVADSGTDGAHNESSVAITGLSGTTEYEFQVRIDFTGSVGESAASTAASAKTLIPSITPSVATGANDNSLAVSWTAPAGGTPDGFEYAYQQGTHTSLPAGISWNDVPDSGSDGRSNETSYAVPSLDSGTTYTIWVRGEKTDFTSATPAAVTQTTSGPWRPTGLTATPGGTEIALDWDDRPSASVAANFEYKCEPTASPTMSGWSAIAASTSEATATGLTVNTGYTCTVRSRTGSSPTYAYSSPARTVAATTSAHLPPTLTAAAGTDLRTIDLTWTMAAGFDAALSGFQYRYEQGAADPGAGNWDQDWTDVPDNADAGDPDTDRHDERAFTITGLVGNTGYYIQLRAQYGADRSAASSGTATAKAVAAPTVSPQSIDLSPTPEVHPGAIALGWIDTAVVVGQRRIPVLQPPNDLVNVYGPPTYRTGYEYRYEKGSAAPTNGMWDQDWTDVPDMDDPTDGRGDENAITLTGLEFNTGYYIQIRSQNSSNYGDSEIASVSRTSGEAPSTIPTPTAPSTTANSVTLQWSDLGGVVREFTEYNWQYRYRIKPGSGTPAWTATWNDVADGSDSGDSAHDENRVQVTGLTGATEYEFQIRVRSGEGASTASATVAATTGIPSITPTVATGADDNSLAVSWTIPGSLFVDGFEYAYRQGTHGNDPGSRATWTDVPDSGSDGRSNETSVTISSLDSGTTYTVWLRAEKSGFTAAGTVAATQTTSGPWRPTGFAITRGATSLTLSWDAKPAGASVGNFQYRCAATNLASASWSTTTDGTATSVVVSSLNVGTNYTCAIRARTGSSAPFAYSSPDITPKSATTHAFVPPVAPAAATGASTGSVNLTWSVPAAASGQLSGYEYQYKKPADANYPSTGAGSWTSAGGKTATSFTVTGLDGNQDYDFRLRSVFGTAGYSDPTAKVSAKSRAVAAPASLSVGGRTGYPGQITLTWVKNTGVSTQNGFQYRYEEGLSAPADDMWDQDWTDVPGSTGATLTYHVPGLKAGVGYYFQVRSNNAGTNGVSEPRGNLGNARQTPSVAAPSTSSVAATSLTLQWTRPTALNAAFTEYQWQYRYKKTATGGAFTTATGGAPWTAVADSTRDADSDAYNETQVDITGLDGSTEYEFQVRIDFTGAVGESAASSSHTVKTLIPSITPTVTATSSTDNGLTVTWTAPSGGTIDGFEYAYRKGTHTSLPADITWNEVPDSGSNGRADETTQALESLHSGSAYTVWLRGEKTGYVSAGPPAVTRSTTGPWYPTSFTATPSGTRIVLDWDDKPSAGVATNFEYKCEPSSSTTSGGWTAIAATASTATVSSLDVNTAYTCSVRSRTGSSAPYAYSSPVETIDESTQAHLAPTLSASAGTAVSEIDLSWTMPTGYDSALSGFEYRYEQGTAAATSGNWDSGPTDGWQSIGISTFTAGTRTGAYTITGLTGNIGYYIELRAVFGTEYSAEDDTTATAKAVAAPTVTPVSQDPVLLVHPGAITLRWSDPSSASRLGYEYRYEKGSAAPTDNMWDQDWTDVPDMDDPPDGRADETTITLTGLEFNTAYFIQMRSENSGANGYSEEVGATRTSGEEPSTLPTLSTSGPTSSSVRLSWTALTGVVTEFTEFIWQYRYRVKPGSGTPAWTATWNDVADSADSGTSAHDETGVTVTSLTATTEYEFQVRIKSGDGTSGVSNTAAGKTLIPSITPTVAVGANDNSLAVSWAAPSGGTPDGFEYAHREGTHTSLPAGITWNDVPDTGSGRSNETSVTVPSLDSGTTYTVWLRGEKTGFNSAAPAAVTQTTSGPWRPTSFTATPAGTSIALDWDDRPSASVAAHFEYKCEPTASVTSVGWSTPIVGTTSAATVQMLTVNAAYTCEVRSRTGSTGSYEYSSPATTATAMTLAHLAPTLTASAGSAVGSIDLSWTMPSGYDTATLSGFQYRYEEGSAAPADSNWDSGLTDGWQDIALSTFTVGTRTGAHTITSLNGNTDYYVELRAVFGTEYSAADSNTAPSGAVAAPTSFTLAARTGYPGQLTVSWQDATNTDRTGYEYRYEEGSAAPGDNMWDRTWTAVPSSTGATRSFNLTGLKANTQYYVQLRATHGNNKGNSTPAATSGTTTAAPTVAAPTASSVTATSLTLSWTTPAALNSAFTAYQWQYRYKKTASGSAFTTATGGAPWTAVADSTRDADSDAHNESQVDITGLDGTTEYEFQVRIDFTGSVGESAASSSATVKTLIPSITPTVAATAGTNTGLTISWSIPSGGTLDGLEYAARKGTLSVLPGDITWTDVTDTDTPTDGNADETSQAVASLHSGSTYTVWVRGEKSGFTSATPTAATASTSGPWRPTSFTATAAGTSIALDWNDRPSASAAAHFEYKCEPTSSTTSGGWNAIVATTSAATVSSLTVNTAHTCSVRSRTETSGSYVYSEPVETVAASTQAHLAPSLTASAGTAVGSIDLSWTLAAGYDSALSGFEYRYEQGAAAPADSNWDSGSGWQSIAVSTFNSGSRTGSSTVTGLVGNTQYFFQLRAVYDTETSSADDATADSRAVAAPTSFTVGARASFPGQLAVSWQDVANTNRSGYQYRYDEGSAAPGDNSWDQGWTTVPSSTAATRSFNISGLKAGTTYYVEVRSTHTGSQGNSEVASGSGAATAIPTVTAPTTSAVGTTSTTLSWTRPATSALASSIITYNWQYRYKKTASGNDFTTATGGLPWTDVADSARDVDSHDYNETQIGLTGLTAATEYEFQVRINFDDSDWGETAAVSVTTMMLIPTPSITASAGSDPGSVDIGISAYATGVTVDNFQVRQVNSADSCATTTASGWTSWSNITGTGSSAVTHTISGLTTNTRWKFEVRPVKSGFTSQGTACESLMVAMVPAPTSFTVANVANTPGSIKLDWTGPTSNTIANFAYRYRVTSGGSYTTATGGVAWTDVPDGSDSDSLARNERTITLTGLKAGTGYTVQLRVEYSTLGDSGPVSATATTLSVNPPTSVSATSTANSVTVSWTASSSTGVTRVDYRYRKTGGSWSSWTNGPSVGTSSQAISSLDGASEYQVEVRAHVSSAVGNSAAATVTQKTLIPAITNLAEDSATQDPGTITLKWDALDNNARVDKFQYRYERGTQVPSDGNWDKGWTDVSANGSAAVTHAVSGLAAQSDYYFQVQAVKTGYTAVSANLTGTSGAHITLSGVSASTGTPPGSVSLSWTKPTHDNITEYRYRFKKASDAAYPSSGTGAWAGILGGATTSSLAVANLENNVSYNFEVLAHYGSVTGSSTAGSATATSKTLPAPSNFDATQGTLPGSIALTWSSMATTSEVDKFQYRFEAGSTAPADNVWDQDWTDVPSSTRSTTSFQITGRTSGATFLIQLRAVGTGNIGVSGSVQDTSTATTAPAPTGFSANTGSAVGEVEIAWNAGTGISAYQYRYKRTTDGQYPSTGAGAWTAVPDQDTPPDGQGDETSYTVTGLVPGVEYHIQIRAQVVNVGTSAATTAQTVTVKSVAAPRNFSASSGSIPGTISLSWSAVQTSALRSGDSIVQYEYRYKLQSDASYGAWNAVPDGSDNGNLASDETSAIVADLSNGERYDIQLRGAIDDNDPDSTVDYYTDSASRTGITARVVSTPSSFRAASSSSAAGAIDLTWTAQTAITASSAQYEYRYKLSTASSYGAWTPVTDGDDSDSNKWNEASATISGLTAETSYDIELRFFVSNDVGASSATRATASASRVPSAMNFSANPGGAPGSINLTWESVDGASKYEYRCNPAGTGCTTTWQEVPDGADGDSSQANETAYTFTGLTAGVRYSVELRAFVDSVGYGAVARSSSLAQTQPGPASITFTQGANPGEITVTWTAPTQGTVARYEFQYRISGTQYNAWADAGTSPNTITGLNAGSRYDVRFRVATSTGGYSLPNVGTLNTKPVPPPTSFTASMGDVPGAVDLGWTAPTGVTILRFEYRHRTGTGSWSSWSGVPDQDDPPNNNAGDETSYVLSGLLGGASYTVELRAVMQTIGHSASVSATVSATPIPPPTDLVAEAGLFPGDIDISWTAAEGATAHQYRAKLTTATWSSDHVWTSVAAPATTATISGLAQGEEHDVEVRAVVTDVGYSPAIAATATTTAMVTGTAEVPTGYALSAARVPGRIVITLPSETEAVVYRTQPTNPGAWSPYITYRPGASERQFEIPGLKPGTEYNVEAHFYLAQQQVFTQALRATLRTAPLATPSNFTATSSNGVMLLSWDAPGNDVDIDGYEYRTRPTGASTWSDWVSISSASSGSGRRQHHVPGLEPGVSHDFELRFRTAVGPGPAASARASAMLRTPSINGIEPVIANLSIRTESMVIIRVNVIGTQGGVNNDATDQLEVTWYATGGSFSEQTTRGGEVVYMAPPQQGYYRVTATAGPAGICRSHHVSVSGTDPCEAKFTIEVTSAPKLPGFSDIPENPEGVIPETITGDDSLIYTVMTPRSGGTVTAGRAMFRAQPAAVLSGEYIAVRIAAGDPVGSIGDRDAESATPAHDAYAGFRTHTLAGNLYSFAAVDSEGAQLDEYELVIPAVACVPLPSNLQDDTRRIVLVAVPEDSDAGLTVLGSRTYSSGEYGTQVCASVRTLPFTAAAAIRGIDESLLPLDPTGAQLPDAGGFALRLWWLFALFLVGLAALAASTLFSARQRVRATAKQPSDEFP